jgi:hypothetical protein
LYSELAGRSFTEMFFAAGQYQKLVERYENMSLEQAQERLGTEFSNIRKYAKILKQENSPEKKEPVQPSTEVQKKSLSIDELTERAERLNLQRLKYEEIKEKRKDKLTKFLKDE